MFSSINNHLTTTIQNLTFKTMELTPLVIRSTKPQQLADFYKHFGMTFEYHRHGNGPYHYSGHIGPTLLEIYPMAKGQEHDLSGKAFKKRLQSYMTMYAFS
jgi:hypothetical protein